MSVNIGKLHGIEIHCESKKGRHDILLSISLLNIDRFSQFFHRRTQLEICNKIIKIPPHLRCVATLPCEMFQQDSAPAHRARETIKLKCYTLENVALIFAAVLCFARESGYRIKARVILLLCIILFLL